MRKVFLILSSLLLIVLLVPTDARADNANPPKILDLIQVTQGPYKPGDLVTYKIIYTGGNPGLKSGDISFAKWDRVWFHDYEPVNEIHGNGLISFPLPVIPPGVYGPLFASILDKTQLRSPMWTPKGSPYEGPLSFVVGNYEFKPIQIGEISPVPLKNHTLDLQMISKNPQVGDKFLLPKYSSVGAPVFYAVNQDSASVCKITQEEYTFPLLPGGQLTTLNNGICIIFITSDLGARPSYAPPQVLFSGLIEKYDSIRTRMNIQVGKISSDKNLKTITCIKGKTTKKVSGTNPKCPKGYKKSS